MQPEENLELQALLNAKEQGFNYRLRRSQDWRENYELARDRVTVNRLTQRQSVNLPLMKTTLRTLLKDVDDMPVVVFQNLDNDKQKEVFQNEYWKWTLDQNNAVIQDIVDKKQDFFFGRTFDSWQIEDGKITFNVEDPEDILIDRYVNPYDIDSARFIVHINIFRPLSVLRQNEDYDQKALDDIEEFFKSQLGIVKAEDNLNALQEKNRRMQELGVPDTDDPVMSETYVQLSIYYIMKPNGEKWTDHKTGKEYTSENDEMFVYVEAEDRQILMKKPQEKIIGVTEDNYWRNHYRFNTWGDDIDNQDFWSDGIADIVRVPNKVLNSWFSQMVENRTLRNFGMNYYDATLQADGFDPNTFNPQPWGWYPVPGKPQDVLQKVDIPALSESLDEMQFVIDMTNRATASTDTQQGVISTGQRTLGEVELAQAQAKARVQGMSKFYTRAWEQRAYKFLKLIEAASDQLDVVKIYKEGNNSNDIYGREIAPTDWMSKSGYRVKVWSQDEKKANDTDSLNKGIAALNLMPDNVKLREIIERKALELADLKPEEITQIMDFEKQKNDMMQQAMQNGMLPQQPGTPFVGNTGQLQGNSQPQNNLIQGANSFPA